ncbi:hypothetical protein ESCO_002550 [Escovopsis weberi]|uniref:Myb-like domain-containing protein n=1 Tax=Escovopsis weberi TaxID=150374 RepID=A0A0M9VT30_ESCWE|nr:hypothetical protein ESCO_002550 [Escovopsis weberi]
MQKGHPESQVGRDQGSSNSWGQTSAFDGASFKGEGEAWTLSEDCAIRGMKESGDGLSWTEIAESLGRTRSDVKSRWKWIQAYLASAEEKRKSQDSGPRKSEDRKGGKATDIIDKGKGNASPSIPLPKKENNGVQAPPVQKGGCSKSKRDKTGHSAACLDTLSGEEASSELSVSDDAAFDLEDEARRQDRYLQETLRGELYGPAHASIQPDELFGPRDSQILAAAESKYHRSKWLEMQANFYNATGRMVPLELIRAKCERAERERYLDSQPAMNGGHKVRQWMSQLEREEAARR